jgi:hypothetical protein
MTEPTPVAAPLVHCLTVEWADDTDTIGANLRIAAIFDELSVSLRSVATFRHGPSLGMPGSVDYAAVIDFSTPQAFKSYVAHDLHQVLRDLLKSRAQHRQHIQFITSPEGQNIAEHA